MSGAMPVAEYDAGWESQWDDMKKYGPMSRHIRRIIKALARRVPFESVLDVGAGQGSLLQELMGEFPRIRSAFGCDISPKAVDMARRKVPAAEFAVVDVEHGPLDALAGRTFDLVICSEVLEHIPDDLAAMRHLRRLTRGHLIVSTMQGRMRAWEPAAVGHVRNYARGELRRKLEQAGFQVVKQIDFGFPFYSPLYRGLLSATGSRGTTGAFGPGRRLLSAALYYLFLLNLPIWGDEVFILARPADGGVHGA